MITNKLRAIFGIPNMVTVSRIVLTPFFVVFLLKGDFSASLFVFAVAGISDGLDGFVARYFDQKTVLGTYLDPVADKLLLVSAFICLPILNIIPNWIAWVVISREILISIGVLILVITNQYYEVNPSFLSKCNTLVQIVIVFKN